MDALSIYLVMGFCIAFGFAIFASYGNYCTMGAVSDWVNMGDKGRLCSWGVAAGVAIVGVALANTQAWIDTSLVTSSETSPVPYLSTEIRWLRHILGGLMFGIGMTLAGGCSSKNLLRAGAGDLKAMTALIALGIAAWCMVYTETGGAIMLGLGDFKVSVDSLGVESQSVAVIIASVIDAGSANVIAVCFGCVLLALAFANHNFRKVRHLWVSGVGIGMTVLLVWALSSGPVGQAALEVSDFSELPTMSMGAQSLSFTLPVGQGGYYLLKGGLQSWLTLGVVMAFGVLVGGVFYAQFTRSFRWQWFTSLGDALSHIVGGLLMGAGGVIAMGCTIGQGITGISTLAIGSCIAFASILLGCAITLRIRLYSMCYEDASAVDVLLTALAETHLLPSRARRLEKV